MIYDKNIISKLADEVNLATNEVNNKSDIDLLEELLKDAQDCINKIRMNNESEMGNVYKTKQLAEQAKDKQKSVVRITNEINKLNDGWEINWNNRKQSKYGIFFDHDLGKFQLCEEFYFQHHEFYLKDDFLEILNQDDLKIIFGVK